MFNLEQLIAKGARYLACTVLGVGIFLSIIVANGIVANASTINNVDKVKDIESTDIHSRGWTMESDGLCHYINGNGSYKTGWLKVLEKDYSYYSYLDEYSNMDSYPYKSYLDSKGVKMTGWVKDNGKQFYLDKDGIMLSNMTIDGYKLGIDGALIGAK